MNSFEQLCINFANEKLHQFFLQFVFKMEEQIYTEECIRGIKIDYADNQPCIELVEKPPLGIFRLLDSQCKTPKATDTKFCAAVYESHSKNAHLVVPKRRPREDVEFTVRHFAGDVAYSCANFLEKNNDSLDQHFKQVLSASTNAVAREVVALAEARGRAWEP